MKQYEFYIDVIRDGEITVDSGIVHAENAQEANRKVKDILDTEYIDQDTYLWEIMESDVIIESD